jgi:hypothetical protein
LELEHSGVKGMRWRKGRKTPLDPALKTNLKKKEPNSNPRIENRKDLALTGKANKKLEVTEKNVDNRSPREKLAEQMAEAAAKDRQDRAIAAQNALKRSIAKAKKAAEEKPVETPKKETKFVPNRIPTRHVSRYRY